MKEGQFVLYDLPKDLNNILKYILKIMQIYYLGTEKVHP